MEHRISHRIKGALDVEIWHRESCMGRHSTTRHVYDSGLALLLLHQHAGELKDHIHLINCRPRVRKRLTGSPIGSRFHIG